MLHFLTDIEGWRKKGAHKPIVIILLLIMAASAAFTPAFCADEQEIPPILDPKFRHQQTRQIEFAPYGGSYLGATVGQTWSAGGRLYYHLDNTWSFGANLGYSRLLTDTSSSFGQTLVNKNMYYADAEAVISNDAAFRAGRKLYEMDFYATLGAGVMRINSTWEPAGLVGGGVRFHTPIPWLAFRIDINNYLHYTDKPGKDPFDLDTLFLGGISLMTPGGSKPFELKQ